MTIEELNELIKEIERNDKEYETLKLRRRNRHQRRRKREELKKNILFLSITIPLSTAGILATYYHLNNEMNNIYNGDNLKITSAQKEKITSKIEEELNINLNEENIEEDLIINAILQNNNLTEEQKELYGKEVLQIIESDPYILKENVYNSLLNLKINYETRPFYIDESIQGEYHYEEIFNKIISKIYIYSPEDENVMEHELTHCILMNLENSHFPRFIVEGLTELLTIENFSENPYIGTDSYPFEMAAVKLLCEVVGEQTVLESYTRGDINLIYDKLIAITPDINPEELMNEIDKVLKDFGNRKRPEMYKVNKIHNIFLKYYVLNASEINNETFGKNLKLFDCLMEEYPYTSYLLKVADENYAKKLYFNTKPKNKVLKKQ